MSILRVTPEFGTVDNALEIGVAGMHFENYTSLFCHFGSMVVKAKFVNSTYILCKTPPTQRALVPRNGFSVPVKVSTDGEDESIVDSNVFYTYFNQIQLISLNPTSAFVGGNSTVVVVGESFIDTSFLTCYFGMHQVRATYVSSTEVTCNVPPISHGNYKVSVSLNGLYADKSSVSFAFNIFAKPIVSSIYPNRLLVQQKARVLLRGSHFAEIDDGVKAQCSFGVEGMSMAHVISDTEIECDAPVAHKASAHETQRIKIISERNSTEEQVVTSTAGKAVANEIQAITIASRGDKAEVQTVQSASMLPSQEIQTIVSTCSSRDEQQLFGIEVFPEIWEVQRLIVDAPPSTNITGFLLLNVTFSKKRTNTCQPAMNLIQVSARDRWC